MQQIQVVFFFFYLELSGFFKYLIFLNIFNTRLVETVRTKSADKEGLLCLCVYVSHTKRICQKISNNLKFKARFQRNSKPGKIIQPF